MPGHIDYISYYTFLLQTVAIAVLIAYLILMPLLGVSIYEAIANIIYRAYVPRAATRAGDLVLGTRPVMPLGGWAGRPIIWTAKERAGRLVLFLGADADRSLRAVARRQYGAIVLIADPAVEGSWGRAWDLWTRRLDVPARPPVEGTIALLRALAAADTPSRVYVADLPGLLARFPELLPLILTPPPHLTISASVEQLATLPQTLSYQLLDAARYFAIFRLAPADLQLLLPHAPDLPQPRLKLKARLRAVGRPRPVSRLDLPAALTLKKKRCLVVANGYLEGEVILWSGRIQGIPLLL